MTSDMKVGLLLGLVFIFTITFIINGLPNLGNQSQAGATPIVTSQGEGGSAIASQRLIEETSRISLASRDWIVQKARDNNEDLSDLTKLNRAIALVACMANEPSIARDAIEEALILAPGDSNLLVWKGNLHLFEEELTEASITYERAINVAKKAGNRQALAAAYKGIALARMRMKRTVEAEANLKKALPLYEALSMHDELEDANRLLKELQTERIP